MCVRSVLTPPANGGRDGDSGPDRLRPRGADRAPSGSSAHTDRERDLVGSDHIRGMARPSKRGACDLALAVASRAYPRRLPRASGARRVGASRDQPLRRRFGRARDPSARLGVCSSPAGAPASSGSCSRSRQRKRRQTLHHSRCEDVCVRLHLARSPRSVGSRYSGDARDLWADFRCGTIYQWPTESRSR
jgi:hypothetical protein